MNQKALFKAGVVAAVIGCATAFSALAQAATLKVQTSSNASHLSLVYLNEKWAPILAERTKGRWKIELLPIRAVVPHRETPQAVSKGILNGDLTAVSYFSGKDPAFALLGDLIAGYDTPDQISAYCAQGGGTQLLQKLWDKYQPGVTVVGCGTYNREAFVSKVPIKGVDDFKGKKIRAPEGLAADVFRRVGASPVSLPASEVYTSLEKGVVDGADNSAYANNDSNGLHKVAKFPIYPGIHSMPVLQFTVSTSTWKKMTPEDQKILAQWYVEAFADLTKVITKKDEELVTRDKAGGDITIIDWPQSERDKFRELAKLSWEAFAASSPLGKEVYDSHVTFMKKLGLLK